MIRITVIVTVIVVVVVLSLLVLLSLERDPPEPDDNFLPMDHCRALVLFKQFYALAPIDVMKTTDVALQKPCLRFGI